VVLPDGEEIMTLAFFVLTRRVTDGRTDGHVTIAKTRASIAGKKDKCYLELLCVSIKHSSI